MTQIELPFESAFSVGENPSTWTPRDIWGKLDQGAMSHFAEQKRIEYKTCKDKVNYDQLATYLSTYSNTVDGGVLVYGANCDGVATGCRGLSETVLNRIEKCHLEKCPRARPEFRRFPVMVDGVQDFCLAVYIPYMSKLTETNKGEAWIRYGDSKRKMSEEEKRDFRSTRQEKRYEQEESRLNFPSDFDENVIEEFCSSYRSEPGRGVFSDVEVLIDAGLGKLSSQKKFVPYLALVLFAGKRPKDEIPGARLRIQRFLKSSEGSGEGYNPTRDITIEGNVPKLIHEGTRAIESILNDVTWLNNEGKFVTTKEYPKHAWLEALTNALVHRSYSYSGTEIFVKFFPDRVVFESPGSFVPPVNEDTIYMTRAARNFNLMDALRYLGYVRMSREGTRRIKESMAEVNLPEPKFTQSEQFGVAVWVTLWNDHDNRKRATDRDVAQFFGVDVWKMLQEHEIKILAFAFRNKKIQVADAQRLTGRTWHTSKKDLLKLTRDKFLEYVEGAYKRDPSAHFKLVFEKAGSE